MLKISNLHTLTNSRDIMKNQFLFIFLIIPLISMQSQEKSAAEVHDHHHQAFLDQNVEELLKDYDDESVLITPDGNVHKGTQEIRNTFEYAFQQILPEKVDLQVIKKTTDEGIVFLLYSLSNAETGEPIWKFATDTFIIKDGKIKYQTVSAAQ